MPQRFLRPGIVTSERYNAVSFQAQNLFAPRLLTLVDDFGRFDGRPVVIWAHSYAVWNELNPTVIVDPDKVDAWLTELAGKELIFTYREGSKVVLQIVQWSERVRDRVKENWPAITENSKLLKCCSNSLQHYMELQQESVKLLPSCIHVLSTHKSSNHTTVGGADAPPTSKECDAAWLGYMQKQECYAHLNVTTECQKMINWCSANHKSPNRRRLINWLNRCEKPVNLPTGTTSTDHSKGF
jgi:hypothetical protein